MALFNDLRSKRQGYVPVAVIPADSNSDEDDVFVSITPSDVSQLIKRSDDDEQPNKEIGIKLKEIPLESLENCSLKIQTQERKRNQPTCASFGLTVTALLILGISLGLLLQTQTVDTSDLDFSTDIVWDKVVGPYASESVVRLVDVNDDGILDLLYALARTSTMPGPDFCESINMTRPCAGAFQAVDGKNGKLIWETNLDSEIYAVICGKLDVDGDGFNDCILAGRQAQLLAVNSRTGAILWSANEEYRNPEWNFYQPQVVLDLDNDGVNEVVIAHGGNNLYTSEMVDREAGRLLLLSGRTGLSLGKYLNMSDDHETYSAITIYERPNGAVYLLFGSGGETVSGSLWAISLRDLYCYVTETMPDDLNGHLSVLAADSYEQNWGGKNVRKFDGGVIEILRSNGTTGVIVPTILADIDNDGIKDLIVSIFNGTYTVLNGNDLSVIWTTNQSFYGYQSYSNPAPGFFNDDAYLDIMVCLSFGVWPTYRQNTVAILDGRDGSTLWSTTALSHRRMMNSPFSVLQTSNKSSFIFWLIGRRFTIQQSCLMDFNHAKCLTVDDDDDDKRRHTVSNSNDCTNDTKLMAEAELLMIDRDSVNAPAVISRVEASNYLYELTNKNQDNINASDSDQNSLQKREIETENGSQCTLLAVNIVATGAISDIDHDGYLDLINIYGRDAVVLDVKYYVRSSLILQRLKLRTHNLSKARIQLHKNLTIIKLDDCGKYDSTSQMTLLDQGWFGYMGLTGRGIYN